MPNARYVTLKPLFSIILEYDLCMATKKSIIERSRLLGLGATSPGGACLLKKRNCEPTARNEWTRYLALIISRTKLVANTTQRCVLWKTWSIWWQLLNFSDTGRWKILGVLVVKGGQNLPPLVGIGLTDLQNIAGGGSSGNTDSLDLYMVCLHTLR